VLSFFSKFAYLNVILHFDATDRRCKQLISWKYSLDKINGELELARKKKQALDKLLEEGKVSQPTYESFSHEVAEAIGEIEAKQNSLVEKMRAKISELEQQMKTLESLLVNSEIRHVSGEIEEEAYTRECNVLSLGLETTKHELNEIKDAISNLSEQNTNLPPLPPETESQPDEAEPNSEERLEIVMDTETTTSIETTMEEQAAAEGDADAPVEPVEEPTENTAAESPVVEEEPFRPDDAQPTEETHTQEAPFGEETPQEEE
jgi:chromosome segregation ATPase